MSPAFNAFKAFRDTMKKHNQELEIDEDLKLERNTWVVQRVSWVLMLLIAIAALLGFTGHGGLPGISSMKAETTTKSVVVEYERYLRNVTAEQLKVHLKT